MVDFTSYFRSEMKMKNFVFHFAFHSLNRTFDFV